MPVPTVLRTLAPPGRGRRALAKPSGPARSLVSALGNRAVGRSLGRKRRAPGQGPTAGELGHQPDPYVRALLQSAVGRDLGDVRVRTGDAQRAVLDASGVDALAHGDAIALRREDDRPGSLQGRALLLHELVHVLQQAQGSAHPSSGPGGAEDAEVLEADARAVALDLVARPADVGRVAHPARQERDPAPEIPPEAHPRGAPIG